MWYGQRVNRSVASLFLFRRPWRRVGAWLGIAALLIQCLVVAFHQPAQAAALSPFQDPAAWCVTSAGDVPGPAPDHKAPLHTSIVCPICQVLQACSAGLVPSSAPLVVPASIRLQSQPLPEHQTPSPLGHLSANPRGPPAPSDCF